MENAGPAVKRFVDELKRQLRQEAAISGRELARRTSISQSKVTRFEAGGALPSNDELEAIGRALAISDTDMTTLRDLVRGARREVNASSWSKALGDKKHLQDDIAQQEAAAVLVRHYQTSLVPGLLQIPDYAGHVFELFTPHYDDDTRASALAARMNRQEVLYQPGKRFEFLITEQALRWQPGSLNSQLAQLDRVRTATTMENVVIGLIPLAPPFARRTTFTTYSHSFTIYRNGEDLRETVSLELTHGPLLVTSPGDVALYTSRWPLLTGMALFRDDARIYLDELAEDLRRAGQ